MPRITHAHTSSLGWVVDTTNSSVKPRSLDLDMASEFFQTIAVTTLSWSGHVRTSMCSHCPRIIKCILIIPVNKGFKGFLPHKDYLIRVFIKKKNPANGFDLTI